MFLFKLVFRIMKNSFRYRVKKKKEIIEKVAFSYLTTLLEFTLTNIYFII